MDLTSMDLTVDDAFIAEKDEPPERGGSKTRDLEPVAEALETDEERRGGDDDAGDEEDVPKKSFSILTEDATNERLAVWRAEFDAHDARGTGRLDLELATFALAKLRLLEDLDVSLAARTLETRLAETAGGENEVALDFEAFARFATARTVEASSVSHPDCAPSFPAADAPYVRRTPANVSSACDPAATIRAPSAIRTSPSGIHAVTSLASPPPKNTRSVCTPVNSPAATARSHLYAEVIARLGRFRFLNPDRPGGRAPPRAEEDASGKASSSSSSSENNTRSATRKSASHSVTLCISGRAATSCLASRPSDRAFGLSNPFVGCFGSTNASGLDSAKAANATFLASSTSRALRNPRSIAYPSRRSLSRNRFPSCAIALESTMRLARTVPTPPRTRKPSSSVSVFLVSFFFFSRASFEASRAEKES